MKAQNDSAYEFFRSLLEKTHRAYLRQKKPEALGLRSRTRDTENPLSFRITKARHGQAHGSSLQKVRL